MKSPTAIQSLDGFRFETAVQELLSEGEQLLPHVWVKRRLPASVQNGTNRDAADARLDLRIEANSDAFRFVVEIKSSNTPRAIQDAIGRVLKATRVGENPMLVVPYLSDERLDLLENEGVSGLDLCGNGVIIVPGRVYISRSGKPNIYPTSRPLMNPYSGRSALVARALISKPRWDSLNNLTQFLQSSGAELSLSQVSKAISAMADDLLVFKMGRTITLREPDQLLSKLANNWKLRELNAAAIRLAPNTGIGTNLGELEGEKWVVSGESSAGRYGVLDQGGPLKIFVSDLKSAMEALGGTRENIRNFADVELVQLSDPGPYFEAQVDELRWASPLQTWLELQCGDGRQQDAAREIRFRIISNLDNVT